MNRIISDDYKKWFSDLKNKFLQSQLKAAIKVNTTLLEFYWDLGHDIVNKQKATNWGSGFIKQLSTDLTNEFPDLKGFSEPNLRFIKRWYLFYTDNLVTACDHIEKNKEIICKIPWGQNRVIISKSKSVDEALYYAYQTLENGWSRAVLTLQVESNLWERQGKAITNFKSHLPSTDSDLAQQILKDPYNFEFLTLTKDFKEMELEKGLIKHIEKFLLELGSGFAFVARQYQLTLSDKEFYCDLLFYHLELRCFVVIDLKVGEFKPEYAGKMNFYCNVVDDHLRKEGDSSTIGMILCKSKDKLIVEYALKRVDAPMGVSEYQITESLPENLQSVLPTIEEIEAELGDNYE